MSAKRASIARFLFPTQANCTTNNPLNAAESIGAIPRLFTTSPNIVVHPPVVTTPPPSGTSVPMDVSPSNENCTEEEHVVGVNEVEMDPTLTPNGSENPSGSPPSVYQKVFVGVAGKNVRDFEPRDEAFLKTTEIVRSHYTGAWTSVSKVPDITKDLWFQEFQKSFYWTVSDHEMRKVFMHQAALHIRNVFKSCRKRGKRPNFITKKQWETVETFRKTNPAMMKQAAANKRNITSQNAKKSGYYRGGSRKMTTWMKVIEKDDGKRPRICDVVRKLWKKEDGTWTGEKPASIMEEQELWVEACDGPQNGRIFALGEKGTAMIRTKTFGCSPTQSQTSQTFQETIVQPFKEEIQELRETIRDLVNQQQVQQQQHLDFQSLILQLLLKLQGNSAPVSNSNYCWSF